jgi:uncharacterized protein YidB (DUF937 family)
MGLLDILGGGGTGRSGMSPLMLGLMGVLAYRTMKGQGRLANVLGMSPNTQPQPSNNGMLGGLASLGSLLGGASAGSVLSGGLGDLLRRFEANGQGEKAQSWVAAGPNSSIAPGELEQALGPERVQWLVQQTGMSKDELIAGLSAKLPQVVDKLTPEGRIPTPEEAERLV